jgi:hypothetical protein
LAFLLHTTLFVYQFITLSSFSSHFSDATFPDLSFQLEQDLQNAASDEKRVCYYIGEEDYPTGHHCMNWMDKELCVHLDISNHKKKMVDISNYLYSRMVHASFSHGYHENFFHHNSAHNEICGSTMERPYATSKRGPAL